MGSSVRGVPCQSCIFTENRKKPHPFYPCVSVFLLPISTLYFWGLHTADAIYKLSLQVCVKFLSGGKVSPKRIKMLRDSQTIFGSLEKNVSFLQGVEEAAENIPN